nr:hypothetical protein Iba_chr02aCG4730 [Ipomoea batatas]
MGLGSNDRTTPAISVILCKIYRATQSSSAAEMPTEGPTWNSHCPGITSPLMPLMLIPA